MGWVVALVQCREVNNDPRTSRTITANGEGSPTVHHGRAINAADGGTTLADKEKRAKLIEYIDRWAASDKINLVAADLRAGRADSEGYCGTSLHFTTVL